MTIQRRAEVVVDPQAVIPETFPELMQFATRAGILTKLPRVNLGIQEGGLGTLPKGDFFRTFNIVPGFEMKISGFMNMNPQCPYPEYRAGLDLNLYSANARNVELHAFGMGHIVFLEDGTSSEGGVLLFIPITEEEKEFSEVEPVRRGHARLGQANGPYPLYLPISPWPVEYLKGDLILTSLADTIHSSVINAHGVHSWTDFLDQEREKLSVAARLTIEAAVQYVQRNKVLE